MTKKGVSNPRVTIDDVAKKAGVSKTTVSRYLNNRFDMMSDVTRLKIEETVEALNFRPSRIAQNLKSKHTKTIGCVIADITSYFATYLVKGISDICAKNGYQVLFVNTNNNPKLEVEGIRSFLDNQVDGLIINTTGSNDDYIYSIKKSGIPVVLADRYLEKQYEIDTISSTNYSATYECLQFLHKQGYDDVFFFGQLIGDNKIRAIRHQAFADGIQELFGKEPEVRSLIIDGNHNEEEIEKALKAIQKKQGNNNVAVFAVNGMMMMDIVAVMKKMGLTLGEEFGLCGFDDWPWASLIDTGITTIRQDTYLTGLHSAERLLNLIEDPEFKPEQRLVELPTQLIVRGSTTIQ